MSVRKKEGFSKLFESAQGLAQGGVYLVKLNKPRSIDEVTYLQKELAKLSIRIAVVDSDVEVVEVHPKHQYFLILPTGMPFEELERLNKMFEDKRVENVTVITNEVAIEERKKRHAIIREAIDARCQYCADGVKLIVCKNDMNVYHDPSPTSCYSALIWRQLAPLELEAEVART